MFNIKRAIEDINNIQQYKADSLNITLYTQFIGFPNKADSDLPNYLIEGDEMRIKQVLINL